MVKAIQNEKQMGVEQCFGELPKKQNYYPVNSLQSRKVILKVEIRCEELSVKRLPSLQI